MNKQGYNKMSLSEQVNEVRESSMSKVDKCKALIKLGFTPYEIEFVLRDSGGKFSFTFGVEIDPSGKDITRCSFVSHTDMIWKKGVCWSVPK